MDTDKPTRPILASRLRGFGTSIFSEMTRLAQQHEAINLGQGFPDFDGPEHLKQAAIEAILGGQNQYARMFGTVGLNRAIAAHQERFYGLTYDPDREVTVMCGATEAIFSTLQALCNPGDEVVMFEPFYDSYPAAVAMAGAVPKVVTLHDPDFSYRQGELEAAIGPRTRLILLNTPHNPTGKVFGRDELEHIAELCHRHDLLAISDEVYEHLVFDGLHLPLAAIDGMAERTVTISSSGKTFSFTGWKIGWACAPEAISQALRTAHQFVTFCAATPLQQAIAVALEADDSYYQEFHDDYLARRDLLVDGLESVGFGVRLPAGTYFALADIRPLGFDDDVELCRRLPAEAGVAAIPPTSFYVDKSAGKHLIRFAFCKSRQTLEQGIDRLRTWRQGWSG